MKIRVLAFLLLLTSLNITSQNISIKKGNTIKDRQFLIDKKEITACDNKGNFVSIRPHRINGTFKNYNIEFFNGLDFSERLEIETKNSTEILQIFIQNNKVYVLIKEISNKNASLRFDLFDLNEKKLIQKILISVSKEELKNIYKALKNGYNISVHHKENFLLSFPVFDDNTSYTYLEYFDNDLNKISQNNIYPNKDISKNKISFLNVIQHNNKAYILYSLEEENNKYYQLTELKNNKTRNLYIPIGDDTYELINTKILKENYILTGLFSKKKKGKFEGFSYYNINLNSFKIVSKKRSEFITEDAKNYFFGVFRSNRSIDIKNLFLDSNNNTYIIGQFYTIRKQYVPIGIPIASFALGSFSAFITYNPISISYKIFDDILIAKINSNGDLLWDKIIEMKQTEKIKSKSNKKDSSYYAFLENNQINILLNGYINMEKDKLVVKQDKRNSKTNFFNITINSQGDILPKIILKNADSDILYRAENSVKSNNTIYNLGQGNMRKQLIKIDF